MPEYSQEDQNLQIWTTLEENELLARRFSGVERISEPYEFQVDLLSENPDIDDRALLRTEMVLAIDGLRFFRGTVRSFSQLGQSGDLTAYRAILVPRLWFLSLSAESRVFREKSIPEILEQVLEEQGVAPVSLSLTGTYPQRDFVVQYRETHLDFVSRLMEEEGIFYFFEHSDSECSMVVTDHRGAHRDLNPEEVMDVPVDSEGEYEEGRYAAHSIVVDHNVHVKRVTLRDVDTDVSLDPVDAEDESEQEDQEEYDYLGRVRRGESRGEEVARARVEAREMSALTLRGSATLPVFEAGRKFNLVRHYRSDVNRGYLLTSVHHDCLSGTYLGGSDTEEGRYRNEFEAIPDDMPFRPPLVTPRPLIHGAHPARVVGGSGDEIHVDAQGRIKVQFFWDREGGLDPESSCWVPVAQGWAGTNRGFLAIPRVDDEVVVEFLEGDPDRPIITGSLYNEARGTIPWNLPEEETMTGLRSLTSTGGGGFNEISVDDKNDRERVHIHAQKDMDTKVLNNQTTSVGVDRTDSIGNDDSESVDNDQTITIGNDQRVAVGQNRKLEVGNDDTQEVGNSRSLTVSADDEVTVGSNHSLSAGQEVSLASGTETSIQAGTSLEAIAGTTAELSAGVSIEITAAATIKITAGSGEIEIGPAGVTIKGPTISLSGMVKHN
jgi:type VI secretion system secreted protein VgrG